MAKGLNGNNAQTAIPPNIPAPLLGPRNNISMFFKINTTLVTAVYPLNDEAYVIKGMRHSCFSLSSDNFLEKINNKNNKTVSNISITKRVILNVIDVSQIASINPSAIEPSRNIIKVVKVTIDKSLILSFSIMSHHPYILRQ